MTMQDKDLYAGDDTKGVCRYIGTHKGIEGIIVENLRLVDGRWEHDGYSFYVEAPKIADVVDDELNFNPNEDDPIAVIKSGIEEFLNDDDDGDWRREIAMEAGMLHGVSAYNEVMGWD
mgnify:CR=1 FL=1